jgi:hypothetical protein
MAIVYDTPLQNGRLQLVNDQVAGLTPAPSVGTPTQGVLVIGTAALVGAAGVLATFLLPTEPFLIAGGVATLQGVPITSPASATGAAAKAEIRDTYGNVIVSGLTVGTAGANIIVSTTAFAAGADIVFLSGAITHG